MLYHLWLRCESRKPKLGQTYTPFNFIQFYSVLVWRVPQGYLVVEVHVSGLEYHWETVRNFTTNIPALPRFLFSEMRVHFFLSFFPSSSFNKFLFCFGQSRFCYLQSKNLNWHNNWLLFLQRSDPLVFREIQMLPHGSFLSLIRIYSLSLPPSYLPSLPASTPSFSWVLSFYFEPWDQSILCLLNTATLEYPSPHTQTHTVSWNLHVSGTNLKKWSVMTLYRVTL